MSDPTISDAELYHAVSDAELNEVNSADLLNPLSYVQATLSEISDENSPTAVAHGNVGDTENGNTVDGDDNDRSRYVPAHHGKFLSHFERE